MSLLSITGEAANLPTPKKQCDASLVSILAVDGGGIKGIMPAFVLQELEESTHQSSANLFEFMSGVSSGSIIVSFV